MPSSYIHKKISKILVGKDCKLTHKIIDYPVRFLGKKHRILFHDPVSALMIGLISDGYTGMISGLLHLATDRCCSKYKIVEKLAEYLL